MKRLLSAVFIIVFMLSGLNILAVGTEEASQVVEEKSITVKAVPPSVLIKHGSSVIITGKGFENGGIVSSLGIIPANTDAND